MYFMRTDCLVILLACFLFLGCNPSSTSESKSSDPHNRVESISADKLLSKYTPFSLTTDVTKLSDSEKQIIKKLIEAADLMGECFWKEAYGDKNELLSKVENSQLKKFVKINYGPWDRLDGNKPFINGIGSKPLGAQFYPSDMSKEEFNKAPQSGLNGLYTFIRRNEEGGLMEIPYYKYFETQHTAAARLLEECSVLTDNKAFSKYLKLRAKALLNDDYQASDYAWLDMKDNHLDVVIGPIETYEDQLFGFKAAHEAYVLVKDMEWSKKLEKYAKFLPDLQKGLPVPEIYKQEEPGRDTELNAYDVIYYSGDCNAGSKTIAINLPNDEEVQLEKGTRRLQLKNAMQAKFEKILLPISKALIDPEQREHIKFDAFFANTMFHEVAHGLGIKNTINGKGTVRKSLKEHASALEEGKADMLGLYMINQLYRKGELDLDLMDYYVTFMTSIFRSVRFGASSAHGKANMIRFNFFKQMGAFTRNNETGYYTINKENLEAAMNAMSEKILTLQGNGDYEGVKGLVNEYGSIKTQLQADLDKLADLGIPVDVIFNQGVDILGI